MQRRLLLVVVFLIFTGVVVADDTLHLANGADVLFIGGSSCSNSYSRAQVLNPDTPWCSPASLYKIESGDTVYMHEGKYTGTFSLTDKSINSDTRISAYPGETVVLSVEDTSGYTDSSNGKWTQEGSLWKTAIDSESKNPRVYREDTSKFFTWRTYEKFTASNYPQSSWYNADTNSLYVKFNDGTDPNSIPIYIANKYTPLSIEGNTGTGDIIISGITFKYNINGVRIVDQSNIIVENCRFKGGHEAIKVNNKDYSYHKNLVFRNNYFDGKQNPVWYEQDMKDEATEETSGILVEDHAGSVYVYNNTFEYWHGGVTLATDEPGECNGSEVYDNIFLHGRGSQIEIESYCSNSVWHDNIIYDSEMGLSLASADASLSDEACEFHHNTILLPYTIRYNPTTEYRSYAIKARLTRGVPVSNWNIHHNTFYGYGRALNSMTPDTLENVRFTDNIFYGNKEYILIATGLSSNGVFFDHNLYYSPAGGYEPYFMWNSESIASMHSSLSAAMDSSYWDGTWDINSVEADPMFNNLGENDVRPREDSPACTLSTTGSYVGALPCVGQSNTAPTQEQPLVVASDYPYNTTDADLHCVNVSTYDADGEAVINSYKWYRNDEQTSFTSNTITPEKTFSGDSWYCEVTPSDGIDTGNTLASVAVVVQVPLPFCGDGIVNALETCEEPNQDNNVFCNQSRTACNGLKLGTRDGYGDCSGECGCDYDAFNYQCVQGECGAECDSVNDCYDGDIWTGERCENNCTCTHWLVEGCGNGIIDNGEVCESPNDIQNVYCNQSRTTCDGNLLGTRDGYGDCNSECGCDYNIFQYACVKDECGAVCESDNDCFDGDVFTHDVCENDCTCTHIQLAGCGNEIIDTGETCEQPGEINNEYCTQETNSCEGNLYGTRDTLGDCNSECGCSYDDFEYTCVADECGAECDSNDDCYDGNEFTYDTCENDCTCTHTEIPGCGNGVIDTGEICEGPSEQQNEFCNQSRTTCDGTLLGTRDGYGDCNSECGCDYNIFKYSCSKGDCGAECETDNDCDDGNEFTADICLDNCMCQHSNIEHCGDGILNTGEMCEEPNEIHNVYCNQSRTTCNGTLLGTRDGYGDCNSECGCDYNIFTYSCIAGECGAECDSVNDCYDNNPFTQDICQDNCTCQNIQLPGCGNGIIDQGEICEEPNDIDNVYCNQSKTTCDGFKLGNRDRYGDCSGECGCDYDTFNYQCVQGECGAECDSVNDCYDGDIWTGEKCENNCTCTHWLVEGCGNGVLEEGETCETPNGLQNEYCNQSTTTCDGTLLGTRDDLGDCDSSCGCIYDQFTYQCTTGECGAECSTDNDCGDENLNTVDMCTDNCMCEHEFMTYCGDGVCGGHEDCASCSADCGECATGCILSDLNWSEDTEVNDAFNLVNCFNTETTFEVVGNDSIIVSIGSDGSVNLTAPTDYYGIEEVYFICDNTGDISNNITLTIKNVADCGDDKCDKSEDCKSCSKDCGKCQTYSGSSGGGSGISYTPSVENTTENITVDNATVENNTVENMTTEKPETRTEAKPDEIKEEVEPVEEINEKPRMQPIIKNENKTNMITGQVIAEEENKTDYAATRFFILIIFMLTTIASLKVYGTYNPEFNQKIKGHLSKTPDIINVILSKKPKISAIAGMRATLAKTTSYIGKRATATAHMTDLIASAKTRFSVAFAEKPIEVPFSIFTTTGLTATEALVKFLKEDCKQNYKQISNTINYDTDTLKQTYKFAKVRHAKRFKTIGETKIPLDRFTTDLLPLETLILYMKNDLNYALSDISTILNYNYMTVCVFYENAREKTNG